MRKVDYFEQLKELLDIACDNPQVWITRNEGTILTLVKNHGSQIVKKALDACCKEGGNINFFFKDFWKWKARATKRAPQPMQTAKTESPEEYYNRNGLRGSMDHSTKTIAQERAEITEEERQKTIEFLHWLQNNLHHKQGVAS